MIRTQGVAHFTIPVTDTHRSQEFYNRHLGMPSVGGSHDSGMIFLDCGGDCVILGKVEGPISTANIDVIHHAFIGAHDEYEAAVQQLKESGVEIVFEEDRQGGIVNGPRAYFCDPDGNKLEIIDLTSYSRDHG